MRTSAVCVLGAGRAEETEGVRTLGLRGHDDEIELKANTVTWRAGGCTQKSFTLQPEAGHVIEASWCQFSSLEQSASASSML